MKDKLGGLFCASHSQSAPLCWEPLAVPLPSITASMHGSSICCTGCTPPVLEDCSSTLPRCTHGFCLLPIFLRFRRSLYRHRTVSCTLPRFVYLPPFARTLPATFCPLRVYVGFMQHSHVFSCGHSSVALLSCRQQRSCPRPYSLPFFAATTATHPACLPTLHLPRAVRGVPCRMATTIALRANMDGQERITPQPVCGTRIVAIF